jgi:SAM-dependent methyltransferase
MNSTRGALKQEMDALIDRHGEWTAMSIRIAEGLNTLEPQNPDDRLTRLVQLASDLCRKPLAETRVLDLACLEGHYAIEFGLQGAEVVGIEVREANIAKARFAKEALGLDRVSFVQDDVRNLSQEKYGRFDIVICSGILYHLDNPDVFQFVEHIADVTTGLALIDTHVSLSDRVSFDYKGTPYWGCFYSEHNPRSTTEERERALWASIDNPRSFWLTRPSLYNLLTSVGFTSVLECHVPPMLDVSHDRVTLAAVKGARPQIRSSPATAAQPAKSWPERRAENLYQPPTGWKEFRGKVKAAIPAPIRTALKRIVRPNGGKVESRPYEPWTWSEPWKRR